MMGATAAVAFRRRRLEDKAAFNSAGQATAQEAGGKERQEGEERQDAVQDSVGRCFGNVKSHLSLLRNCLLGMSCCKSFL